VIVREFEPVFSEQVLVHLANHDTHVGMIVDGASSTGITVPIVLPSTTWLDDGRQSDWHSDCRLCVGRLLTLLHLTT
jgi:hypothetical protein